MYLRFVASIAALAAGAAGIVVVVELLRSVPGPTSETSRPAPAAATPPPPAGFPSPPAGAVVLARELGANDLAVGVMSNAVRVAVVGPQGKGIRNLEVSVGARTAVECGPGCYEVRGAPSSPLTVRVGSAQFVFAVRMPAASGASIVEEATRAWNALKTLRWRERLASDPKHAIDVTYRAVAPDRLAYAVNGGSAAVIIGHSRWDRPGAGAAWQHGQQDPPVRQPQPFWHGVTDAHVVDSTARSWEVTFFDPASHAWFDAWIEKRTYRTVELRMIAASHFMHDTYGPFNAPMRVSPPT